MIGKENDSLMGDIDFDIDWVTNGPWKQRGIRNNEEYVYYIH